MLAQPRRVLVGAAGTDAASLRAASAGWLSSIEIGEPLVVCQVGPFQDRT